MTGAEFRPAKMTGAFGHLGLSRELDFHALAIGAHARAAPARPKTAVFGC
jgi:hypothetical protein